MGVLTDFVVVPRGEAAVVCASSCPSRDFEGMDAKGIDTIKLATLYALLTDGEYDPTFMNETLCSGGDEGPWVFEVPPALVDRLVALRDEQLASVASRWALTEQLQADGWPVDSVRRTLEQIAELGRNARAAGNAVLMWMSL